MGDKTKIAWTDATLNFLYGCDRISPACANCYAIGAVDRLVTLGHPDLAGAVVHMTDGGPIRTDWTGRVIVKPERIEQALRWKKPRRIFINSLSDTFHPDVPDAALHQLWAVMADTPQHTYQVLTKRPERMLAYLGRGRDRIQFPRWPLPNVWLGVTAENQAMADARIPLLLQTPAAVRFVSMEPLLGPVDLADYVWERDSRDGWADRPGLDWVIVGGESGRNARPMNPQWVRGIRTECHHAGVPFFFKQWGEWAPADAIPFPKSEDHAEPGGFWPGIDGGVFRLRAAYGAGRQSNGELVADRPVQQHLFQITRADEHGTAVYRVGRAAAGDLLDGVHHHEFPDGA